MKYYATRLSISKFVFFLLVSFFGVSAHAYQKCQDIVVYSSGACPGGVAACTQGSQKTKQICYEVPDGAGPIPGGSGSGSGQAGVGGGSTPPERPKPPVIPKPESFSANAIEIKLQSCKRDASSNFENNNANCIAAGASVFAISTAAGAGLALYFRDPSLSSKNKVLAGGAITGSAIGGFLADYVRDSCKDYYSGKKDTALSQCDLDKAVKTEECSKYN